MLKMFQYLGPKCDQVGKIFLYPQFVYYYTTIYADDTTLYFKCDSASDLWQHLQLDSLLESDLRDTVDWGTKWLVDFNAGKTQLALFDQSNNAVAIDLDMDEPIVEEK